MPMSSPSFKNLCMKPRGSILKSSCVSDSLINNKKQQGIYTIHNTALIFKSEGYNVLASTKQNSQDKHVFYVKFNLFAQS